MLFYVITYVRQPQIFSSDTMAVPLDSCIVGLWHPKTPKNFVFKSVKNANFWRKNEIFYRAKISLFETPISLWEILNLPIWL